MHIFADAHSILEGLARRDCGAALAWCAQHRARLRKLRSKLEFMLHTQVRLPEPPPPRRPWFPAPLQPVPLPVNLLLRGAQTLPIMRDAEEQDC